MAKRSMAVASIFGLLSAAYVGFTGDEAAYSVAQRQPMKLAAMEGLYDGQKPAPIVAFGLLNATKRPGDDQKTFFTEVKIPGLLSLLANRKLDSFVPGINDLVYGNKQYDIVGVDQRIANGKIAVAQLDRYKKATKNGDEQAAADAFREIADRSTTTVSFAPEGLVIDNRMTLK